MRFSVCKSRSPILTLTDAPGRCGAVLDGKIDKIFSLTSFLATVVGLLVPCSVHFNPTGKTVWHIDNHGLQFDPSSLPSSYTHAPYPTL